MATDNSTPAEEAAAEATAEQAQTSETPSTNDAVVEHASDTFVAVSADADSAGTESTSSESDAAATAEPAAEVAPAKPARKRTTRRATKKAAAPAEAPAAPASDEGAAQGEPQADAATETEAAAEAPAPAKRAPRKRTSRKATAPAAAPEPAPAEDAPAVDENANATESAAADTSAEMTDAQSDESSANELKFDSVTVVMVDGTAAPEPGEEDEDETAEASSDTDDNTDSDDDSSAAPLAVPSFNLLFQAPEPTRTPRRATAAAGAPRHTAEDEADDSSDEIDSSDDEATDSNESSEESSEEQEESAPRSRRRRGGRGRRSRSSDDAESSDSSDSDDSSDDDSSDDSDNDSGSDDDSSGGTSSRRRRRRRRSGSGSDDDDPTVRTRTPRAERDEPTSVKGSTRLEAKKQRRREGREAGRRRTIITEAEFLARRESVERIMVVRSTSERTQMGVLEDGVLVEHYIDGEAQTTMAGNIYLGRVQNVLPSMEAAFVDIGKGRNAVLYAGEVNWDAAGLEANQPKRIENALESGQPVLVQVTKDPIGHKGARLTSQISLPGRYLVYVPNSSMTGISRKLPDTERARLKKILREVVPDSAGVIVRTAAEGASEEELRADVERLTRTWERIQEKAEAASGPKGKSKGKAKSKGGKGKGGGSGSAPMLLHGEPDLTVRVIRDVFNEDFAKLVIAGDRAWDEVNEYVTSVAPDLAERLERWTGDQDLFSHYRIDEQIAKAMDRKVWLPSGGSLVIDRTEAMTVVDVNTGKFVGSGGNLEETVTKNNIEAAEEIVRQLRLRDIGGIIVIDFIDMVLEANRELVVRRLLECLGRDRTKHQVAEVTSLGLVQMTRKRVGSGLIEVFGETCSHCSGRGFIIHNEPVGRHGGGGNDNGHNHGPANGGQNGGSNGGGEGTSRSRRSRRSEDSSGEPASQGGGGGRSRMPAGPTPAQIAAAAHAAAIKGLENTPIEAGETAGFGTHEGESGEGTEAAVAESTEWTSPETSEQTDVPELQHAVEQAVSEREQSRSEDQSQAQPEAAQPEPAARPRRGGRRRVSAPATAPAAVTPEVEIAPVTSTSLAASATVAEEAADSAPAAQVEQAQAVPVETPAQAEQPAPRQRRKRGRVVAPAGPPKPLEGDED